MSDKKKVYSKLQRLPLELYSAYAVRKAIQLMPVLAMTLTQQQAQLKVKRRAFFEYWPEDERAPQLLNLLRALDAALYLADAQARTVIHSRSSIEQLKSDALLAIYAADTAFLPESNNVTVCVLEGIFPVRSIMDIILAALAPSPEVITHLATYIAGSKVLLKEIDGLNPKVSAWHYLKTPLWPGKMPKELFGLWQDLQMAMHIMDAGFEYWQHWYQQRLDGTLMEQSTWERQVFVPGEIEQQGPECVNEYLLGASVDDLALLSEDNNDGKHDTGVISQPVMSFDDEPAIEDEGVDPEPEVLSLEEKINELGGWVEEVLAFFVEQLDGGQGTEGIDQLGLVRQSLVAGLEGTSCKSMESALDNFLQQLKSALMIDAFAQIEHGQSIQNLLTSRVESVLKDLQFVMSQLQP